MRQLFYAISFCIFLLSCSDLPKKFPDNIQVAKTDKLKRIKGTKLFVNTPASYKPLESMVRMQRDNNTYFQVFEIANSNFTEYKSKMTKEAIESQGAKVDIDKPVNYNGYDALYISGPSKTFGETKLMLAFGDKDFVVMIAGVCKTTDTKAMDELNAIFSTSYFDKSFALNPLELAFFTFDESITGFKHAATIGSMFVYSPNGKDDINRAGEIPAFQFTTAEAPTFEKAKEYVDYAVSRYEAQGIQVSNVAKQEITIKGNQAYEVTLQATNAGNRNASVYTVVIHKGSKAVIFTGTDTDNGIWIDKFKATVESIQMNPHK